MDQEAHEASEGSMSFDCQHDESWIGEPAGCVPTQWSCVKCGCKMSAGEMHLWSKITEVKQAVKELADQLRRGGQA